MKTFIFIGQSNLIGMRNKASHLPSYYKKQSGNKIYTEYWKELIPHNSELTSFGPEISFGYHAKELMNSNIGIIKLAKGNTSILNWLPSEMLYKKLISMVNHAKKSDECNSIDGLCFIQGETDAMSKSLAENYDKNIKILFNNLKKDISIVNMPIVCAKINPHLQSCPFIDKIRIVHDNYANVDCLSMTMHDDLHLDAESTIKLGKKLALKMQNLLK